MIPTLLLCAIAAVDPPSAATDHEAPAATPMVEAAAGSDSPAPDANRPASPAERRSMGDEGGGDGTAGGDGGASPSTVSDPLVVGARVHGRFKLSDQDPKAAFDLRRARLAFDLQPMWWLAAQLDADVSKVPMVKDAYVDVGPGELLRVRVGQFKTPYSRIELTSSGRLPLVDRGLVNQELTIAAGFGGRDRGLMVHGSIASLGYAVAIHNGTATQDEVDDGKDVGARLTYKPARVLELGVSGGYLLRNARVVGVVPRRFASGGVDLRLRLARLEVVGEALYAQDPLVANDVRKLAGIAYAVVRGPKVSGVSIRPVAKVEILDQNVQANRDQARALGLGLNLHFAKALRLMVQAEELWAEANSALAEERRLVVQLAFDDRLPLALRHPGGS